MEQNLYQAWLQRKLDQSPFELIRAVTVTKTWRKSTGGRILFGHLTLEATPSETFSYHEEVTWPTDYPYFNGCVIDGILDALLIDLGHTPGNTCFVLKAVEWHEEYSVPRAPITKLHGKPLQRYSRKMKSTASVTLSIANHLNSC